MTDPYRDTRIRELHEEGLSFQQVADELGVTKGIVAGVIHRSKKKQQIPSEFEREKLSIEAHRRNMRGETFASIARDMGLRSRSAACCRADRIRKHYEAENRDLEILQACDDGLPIVDIAYQFKVTREHIRRLRKECEPCQN